MRDHNLGDFYELKLHEYLTPQQKRSLDFNYTQINFRSWFETLRVLGNHRFDFYEVVWVKHSLISGLKNGINSTSGVHSHPGSGTVFFLSPRQLPETSLFTSENCVVISFTMSFVESLFKRRNPLAELPFSEGTSDVSPVLTLDMNQERLLEQMTDKIEGEILMLGTPCSADIIRSYLQIFLAHLIKWSGGRQNVVNA